DGTEYFCRDSKTWDCDDIGRTQPWYLAVDNGYQTSYCAVTIQIVEEEADPVCPLSGTTVFNLDGSCVETFSAAQLAHQNVIDCADDFPDVNLFLPNDTQTSPADFFTNGFTFTDGLTTVVYQTEGGNCAFAIEVRADGGLVPLSCPATQTIDIGAGNCNATVSAAELALGYSGPGTITYRVSPETLGPEVEGTGQMPDYTFERGANLVRYSVEEPGGCSNFCFFSIRVSRETTAPIDFACQDATYPYSVDLDFREAYQAGVLQAEDDCGLVPAEIALGFLTGCAQIGVPQEVRVSVGTGSFEQECTFNLTLTSAFVPNCPVNPLFVNLGDAFPQALPPEDLANWAESPEITATSSMPFIDCGDVGRHFITVTLEDECGNSDSCVRDVRVRDGDRPTISCQNISRSLDENGEFLLSFADILLSADDNCGPENLTFTLDQELFTCDDRGNNTVFLTAKDPGGSNSSCSATVTITDQIFPEITCKDVTIELGEDGTYRLGVNDVIAQANDNCNVGYVFSQRDFSCDDLPNSPVAVTMRGRDASGNSSFCTSMVTIETPDCPCIGADGILVVDNP
ncbi:MAG: hypothetical protein AAGA62_11000, partial [Bacteroidota bacterium]